MKTSKIVIFFLISIAILSGCSTAKSPVISGNTPDTGGQNQQNTSDASPSQSNKQDKAGIDSPNKIGTQILHERTQILINTPR